MSNRRRHTRLPDVDAELDKFAMHPRCAPEWVGKAHRTDQAAYFERHRRPAPANSRFPTPIGSIPARCQRITVSGWTIASASRAIENPRNRPTNINRSMLPKRGLFGAVRRRTLICWRSAKFSATRATLNRNSPMNAHQINLQRSHIGRQHRPCCPHLLAR